MDQDSRPRNLRKPLLCFDQPIPIPDFDSTWQRCTIDLFDLVRCHQNLRHTLPQQVLCHRGHAKLRLRSLATGHRDGAVVEQLVGHVDPGGDRGLNGKLT